VSGYIGRFAPSPTGPLHAGSLVAALASWLDARVNQGQWLVRIEDVDGTRCRPGLDRVILDQLAACGLYGDQPPVYQSHRSNDYQQALNTLVAHGLAYPCGCTRKDIALNLEQGGEGKPRHGELIYPGTCRSGLQGKAARAWRLATAVCMEKHPDVHVNKAYQAINYIAFETPPSDNPGDNACLVRWYDRRLGPQQQDVASQVGDFVLKRADGCFAYQLAVVVDDAAQGITDVVRGQDLADNTARQILLQRALGLPTPRYLHTPLVLGANGEKLSKQNGAASINTTTPQAACDEIRTAARRLGLPVSTDDSTQDDRAEWVAAWGDLHGHVGLRTAS
jgi:glutamyl-Q tRNA(Asp) synthetase